MYRGHSRRSNFRSDSRKSTWAVLYWEPCVKTQVRLLNPIGLRHIRPRSGNRGRLQRGAKGPWMCLLVSMEEMSLWWSKAFVLGDPRPLHVFKNFAPKVFSLLHHQCLSPHRTIFCKHICVPEQWSSKRGPWIRSFSITWELSCKFSPSTQTYWVRNSGAQQLFLVSPPGNCDVR